MIKLYQLLSQSVCLTVLLSGFGTGIYSASANPAIPTDIDELAIPKASLCGKDLTFVYNTEPLSYYIDSADSYNVCVPTESLAAIQDIIDNMQESVNSGLDSLHELPEKCPAKEGYLVEEHELTRLCFLRPHEGSIIFAVKIIHNDRKVIVHWLDSSACPNGQLSELGTYCEFEKGKKSIMPTLKSKFKITKPKSLKGAKVGSWLMPEYTTDDRAGELRITYRIVRGNFECASTERTGIAPKSKLRSLTSHASTHRFHGKKLTSGKDLNQTQDFAQNLSASDEPVGYCSPGLDLRFRGPVVHRIIDSVLPMNASFPAYPHDLDHESFM